MTSCLMMMMMMVQVHSVYLITVYIYRCRVFWGPKSQKRPDNEGGLWATKLGCFEDCWKSICLIESSPTALWNAGLAYLDWQRNPMVKSIWFPSIRVWKKFLFSLHYLYYICQSNPVQCVSKMMGKNYLRELAALYWA